jgi:hypothetical protein
VRVRNCRDVRRSPPATPSLTSDPTKIRRGIIITFLAGIFLTGVSAWSLATGGTNSVTCGSQAMLPGDTCETRLYGVIPTGARSYDTERTINHWAPWGLGALGIVSIGKASRGPVS